MSRLIDADKINYHDHTECMGHGDFETVRTVTDKEIAEIPTADAVPVVRCRECNHCDPENYHCDHPMSTAAPLRRKPDDFCSYGERKNGDRNG